MKTYLTAKASIQIQRPASEVFDAIIDPEKMKNYFALGSDRLVSGHEVTWSFPEFPEKFPVLVKEIVPHSFISFDWSSGEKGMLVELSLESMRDESTVVRIEEHQMPFTELGVQQALQQTEGWANFLACLKAYLEYGIQLRKGAFDFTRSSVNPV